MQQSTTCQILQFSREQMNTFQIQVRLYSNQKLSITLYDYIDWKIYQKQYTENDIGKQIHCTADLQFIYSSLSQNNTNENESKPKSTVSIKDYHFGQCVKYGEICCYKVESEGRVTVYKDMIQVKTNKKVCYQSKLKLIEVREMNQMQIFTQKTLQEKAQSSKKFIEELEILRDQKKQLAGKYQGLEKQMRQQQRKTNEELQKQKKQMDNMKQYFEKQIQLLRNQVKQSKNIMKDEPKAYYGQSDQWKVYKADSVSVKVSYEHLNLQKVPKIFTCLYGNGGHFTTTGATSIYSPTNKQFTVFIKGLSQAQMVESKIVLHYQIIPQQ